MLQPEKLLRPNARIRTSFRNQFAEARQEDWSLASRQIAPRANALFFAESTLFLKKLCEDSTALQTQYTTEHFATVV